MASLKVTVVRELLFNVVILISKTVLLDFARRLNYKTTTFRKLDSAFEIL